MPIDNEGVVLPVKIKDETTAGLNKLLNKVNNAIVANGRKQTSINAQIMKQEQLLANAQEKRAKALADKRSIAGKYGAIQGKENNLALSQIKKQYDALLNVDKTAAKKYVSNVNLFEDYNKAANAQRKAEADIDRYQQKLEGLRTAQTAFVAQEKQLATTRDEVSQKIAGNTAEQERQNQTFNVANQRIVDVRRRLQELEVEQAKLAETGMGFGIEQFDQNAAEIARLKRELEDYIAKLRETEEPTQAHKISLQDIRVFVGEIRDTYASMSSVVGKLVGKVKDMVSSLLHLGKTGYTNKLRQIVTMVKALLGLRGLYMLFRKIRAAFKEGFNNLVQYSSKTNEAFSAMKSSLDTLKNALAVAFDPIIQRIVPILTTLMDALTDAMNYVSMFFAVLSGSSTYIRAVKLQEDYAASLDKTAKSGRAAADALDKYANPLDQINRYESANNRGGGGSGKADTGIDPKDMFETVGVEAIGSISQAIQDGNWFKAGRLLADKVNTLVENFDAREFAHKLGEKINNALDFMWGFVSTTRWDDLGRKLADAIDGLVETVSPKRIGQLLASKFKIAFDFLFGLSEELWENNTWSDLGEWLAEVINSAIDTIPWARVGKTISNFVTGIVDLIFTAFFNIDWGELIEGIILSISQIDFGAKLLLLTPALIKGVKFWLTHAEWGQIITEIVLPDIGKALASFFAPLGAGLAAMAIPFAIPVTFAISRKYNDKATLENSDVYQEVLTLKDQIESSNASIIEFSVGGIKDVTEGIDPDLLAKIETAKTLIDKIFTLYDSDLNDEEWSTLEGYIDTINNLGLGTVVQYDSATRQIITTRTEVYNLIEALLQQARAEAATELLKDATKDLLTAEQNRKTAVENLKEAEAQARTVSNDLNKVREEAIKVLERTVGPMDDVTDSAMDAYIKDGYLHDATIELNGEVMSLKDAWLIMNGSMQEAASNVDEARAGVQDATKDYNDASGAVEHYGEVVADEWAKIPKNTKDGADAASGAVSDSVTDITENVSDMADNVTENITDIKEAAQSGSKDAANAADTATSDIEKDVSDMKSNVTSDVEDMSKDASGSLGGISEGASSSTDAAKTAVSDSMAVVKNELSTFANLAKAAIMLPFETLSNYDAYSTTRDKMLEVVKAMKAVKLPTLNVDWSTTSRTVTLMDKTSKISIPTPKLQWLAQGAVIPPNAPFLAMLGDQKQGTNIETPETLLRQVIREESGNKGNKYNVNVSIGRRQLLNIILDEAKLARQTTGRNIFELT